MLFVPPVIIHSESVVQPILAGFAGFTRRCYSVLSNYNGWIIIVILDVLQQPAESKGSYMTIVPVRPRRIAALRERFVAVN